MSEKRVAPGPDDLARRLGALLPGFEARFDEARNAIAVRGMLTIEALYALDTLYLPASTDERVNAETAERIASECRRLAIEATGLDQLIAERVEAARKEGYDAGREFVREAQEKAWDEGGMAMAGSLAERIGALSYVAPHNPYRKRDERLW